MSASKSDTDIHYTTDGSYPTYGSKRYTDPITIDKTTVLRAMSVKEGEFPSERITHTYLINEATVLPVISISTDWQYLWDDMIGIYVEGRNGIKKVCGRGNANYMQNRKRPAHIEEFKSFKLRNSGQDWWKTMFRDAMVQQLIKDDLDIDYQAYEPSIVFINGEYWGIHNIREKKNEDYLANNYPDIDPDKVDILYEKYEVKEGRADDYIALIAYIENHDLSYDENYEHVVNQIDLNNYIDYNIAQIFTANFDWPRKNTRYWKEQKKGSRWRWMIRT